MRCLVARQGIGVSFSRWFSPYTLLCNKSYVLNTPPGVRSRNTSIQRSAPSPGRSKAPRNFNRFQKSSSHPAPLKLPEPVKAIKPSAIKRKVTEFLRTFSDDEDAAAVLGGLGVMPSALHRLIVSQPSFVLEHAQIQTADLEPRNIRSLTRTAMQCFMALYESDSKTSRFFKPWTEIAAEFDGVGEIALQRASVHAFLTWLLHEFHQLLTRRDAKEVSAEVYASLRQIQLLQETTDLRVPENAYSAARTLTRQIHMHVGPTNSGKTHGALIALSRARTGLYCGPLRLLAHEVWERLNEGTISPQIPPRACNLRTGEEQQIVDPLAGLVSCTVEMADPNSAYDVAVVDEIQMIADMQRGSAWTQAVLGLAAKELHLCGEASAVPLVQRLTQLCGDVLHVHEYKRLTPLAVAPHSLGNDLRKIQRGDCVVAFSRTAIFQLKKQIEQQTDLKCAVAYGSLPPETKSEQAKLFNDGKLDVMVASDAIGMGLNLKIQRVIFDTLTKWNGRENVTLSISQIKQIAGRAGRYGTQDSNAGGLALTRHENEMPLLHAAISAPIEPLARAALQPPSGLLESLALLLPFAKEHRFGHKSKHTSLAPAGRARSLAALYEDMTLLAQFEPRSFALADFASQQAIAPILERRSRNSFTHPEKEKWANAPVNLRDERLVAWFGNAVESYADGALVSFEECAQDLGTLETEEAVLDVMQAARLRREEAKKSSEPLELFTAAEDAEVLSIETLMILESHHRSMSLYLWLAYRFPLAFCFQSEVEHRKARTEDAIEFCLAGIRFQRARRLTRLGRQSEVRPEHRESIGV
ncbi:RNA helicase [Malassezia yamatoensis]|uniref:RNA helicase n=1 Tax=Malassezia yamatoensis TaxID=253288 RepID=A0AAJ5YRV2_9BASI|nr:RNA helicase [Malassezia yamatoensis]